MPETSIAFFPILHIPTFVSKGFTESIYWLKKSFEPGDLRQGYYIPLYFIVKSKQYSNAYASDSKYHRKLL